jgi:hypothetical protein
MKRAISNGSLAAAAALVIAMAQPVGAQESYNVAGDEVAIYNLAGEITVTGVRGSEVTVQVMRGGRDASELDVEIGEIGGRQTLRVIYPSDRISYDGQGWGGTTNLRVRDDGTWGGDRGSWLSRGDNVRISSRGRGLDAHADLRVGVPQGREISIYLAVGRITAENVNGRVRLDTHSGGVEARNMAGYLNIDTGSGGVAVVGMDGDLNIDTGSGGVNASDVRAEDIGIDTGSGGVEADGLVARRINIDTGSGGITMLRSAARDVRLDTGSGSVRAELGTDVDDVEVDTGSGSVTLVLPDDVGARVEIETGSGGIDVDFPIMVTHRARDELRGTIGDGDGVIHIDTGSGSIRLRRQ